MISVTDEVCDGEHFQDVRVFRKYFPRDCGVRTAANKKPVICIAGFMRLEACESAVVVSECASVALAVRAGDCPYSKCLFDICQLVVTEIGRAHV